MKGIYFINDQIRLNGLSREESLLLQKNSIKTLMMNEKIQAEKLNPNQINEYYTIPHALLYDLKKANLYFDCFIYYSEEVMEDFIFSYPAKWLILKSFFKETIRIEKQSGQNSRQII
ncbi:hypothetical protein [Neobacillus fumarioli]|uniref:hypothetical protein n=1 Tax=Neobacillus fumarioli TaxID=105229 RepID=UPI000831F103|nr:hypothetical protein [Neobacillus fumarioli]